MSKLKSIGADIVVFVIGAAFVGSLLTAVGLFFYALGVDLPERLKESVNTGALTDLQSQLILSAVGVAFFIGLIFGLTRGTKKNKRGKNL